METTVTETIPQDAGLLPTEFWNCFYKTNSLPNNKPLVSEHKKKKKKNHEQDG